MTRSSEELLALADRCEAAAGSNSKLDLAIYEAINPPKAANAEPIKPKHGYLYAEPYTASLDAAMTLVPQGWQFRIENNSVHLGERHALEGSEVVASTTPLALCAAALRSLATKDSADGQ